MNLESKMSNTLRFLSADMVQRANSGHPGVAMGLSDFLAVLSKHLIHNPKNPRWIDLFLAADTQVRFFIAFCI